MSRSTVNIVALAGCLVLIGAAGAASMVVLDSIGAPAIAQGRAVLRVDTDDSGGLATLRVLDTVRLGASRVVPAGAEVNTPSAVLTEVMAPAPVPAVGASLTCDLQVGHANGTQVIDLLWCGTPGPANRHG